MRQSSFMRRAILAGTLALSLTGLTASVETALAMPVAVPSSPSADAGSVTTVQYMRYPRYRYRRFNRYRRAGLYRCGPGGLSTHLSRRACRG